MNTNYIGPVLMKLKIYCKTVKIPVTRTAGIEAVRVSAVVNIAGEERIKVW